MAYVLAVSTFFSTLAGGTVALRSVDRLHVLLGLAGGLMLGLIGFDLLPEVFREVGPIPSGVPPAMVAFVVGFLGLHVLERSASIHAAHEHDLAAHLHARVGIITAAALVLHSFLDGFGIGLAFQASAAIGIAVSLAVITHDFADGLNTVTVMRITGNSRARQRALLLADAVAPLVGAVVAQAITPSPRLLALYLAFFAGFLLYIATATILPEAHAGHPSRPTLAATVVGVLLMYGVVSLT